MNDTERYTTLVKTKIEKHSRRTEEHTARRLEMAKLYFDEKLTYAEIGSRYGLTRQRVCQIINSLAD